MFSTVDKVSTYLLLFLGVVHVLFTPVFYKHFSPDALWFAGAGLALVFCALLNLARRLHPERALLRLCAVANFLGCIFGVLIPFAVQQPQAVLAALAFAALSLTSVRSLIRTEATQNPHQSR